MKVTLCSLKLLCLSVPLCHRCTRKVYFYDFFCAWQHMKQYKGENNNNTHRHIPVSYLHNFCCQYDNSTQRTDPATTQRNNCCLIKLLMMVFLAKECHAAMASSSIAFLHYHCINAPSAFYPHWLISVEPLHSKALAF